VVRGAQEKGGLLSALFQGFGDVAHLQRGFGVLQSTPESRKPSALLLSPCYIAPFRIPAFSHLSFLFVYKDSSDSCNCLPLRIRAVWGFECKTNENRDSELPAPDALSANCEFASKFGSVSPPHSQRTFRRRQSPPQCLSLFSQTSLIAYASYSQARAVVFPIQRTSTDWTARVAAVAATPRQSAIRTGLRSVAFGGPREGRAEKGECSKKQGFRPVLRSPRANRRNSDS
jgi:hypothetical protein